VKYVKYANSVHYIYASSKSAGKLSLLQCSWLNKIPKQILWLKLCIHT